MEVGRETLSRLLPLLSYSEVIEDPLLKVRVQFCTDTSGIRYELVAPFGEGNPVSGVLERDTNILNHVAYRVTDLKAEALRLRKAGSILLGPARPAVAFGGRPVMFLLTPMRFIVELIEEGAA